jgi:hypothetical protein
MIFWWWPKTVFLVGLQVITAVTLKRITFGSICTWLHGVTPQKTVLMYALFNDAVSNSGYKRQTIEWRRIINWKKEHVSAYVPLLYSIGARLKISAWLPAALTEIFEVLLRHYKQTLEHYHDCILLNSFQFIIHPTLYSNKKDWEELIAYFPWYDTDHIENDASNNSPIIVSVFVTR